MCSIVKFTRLIPIDVRHVYKISSILITKGLYAGKLKYALMREKINKIKLFAFNVKVPIFLNKLIVSFELTK